MLSFRLVVIVAAMANVVGCALTDADSRTLAFPTTCGITSLPAASVRCGGFLPSHSPRILVTSADTGLVLVTTSETEPWSAQRIDAHGDTLGAPYVGHDVGLSVNAVRCGADVCVIAARNFPSQKAFVYTRLNGLEGPGADGGLVANELGGPTGTAGGALFLARQGADSPLGLVVDPGSDEASLCRFGDAAGCSPVALGVTCGAKERRVVSAVATFHGVDYVSGSCKRCVMWCEPTGSFLAPAVSGLTAIVTPASEWPRVETVDLLATDEALWTIGEVVPDGYTDDGGWPQGLVVRRFRAPGAAPMTWAGPVEETEGGVVERADVNSDGLLVLRARLREHGRRAHLTATFVTNTGVATSREIRGPLDRADVVGRPIGVVAVANGFVAALSTDEGVTWLRFDALGAPGAW